MSQNLVVNGVTYSGVDSIEMQNDQGKTVPYFTDAVRYVEQRLDDEQKAQARENIGAATVSDVLAALPIGEGVRY